MCLERNGPALILLLWTVTGWEWSRESVGLAWMLPQSLEWVPWLAAEWQRDLNNHGFHPHFSVCSPPYLNWQHLLFLGQNHWLFLYSFLVYISHIQSVKIIYGQTFKSYLESDHLSLLWLMWRDRGKTAIYKPKNTWSYQNLRETWNRFLLRPSEGVWPSRHFDPGILASRLWDNKFLLVKTTWFVVFCSVQP